MTDEAIRVRGLVKRYGEREAVAGLDLTVATGDVVAVLGPNGAGKTTTTEILEGFRSRTSGEVAVLGVDPARGDAAWRARLGIVLQSGESTPVLTARETVGLWATYYPHPRPVQEVLDLVGLAAHADTRLSRLSGGQRRRVEVALALVGRPDLLFLDEPTTGFDPDARRQFWEVIRGLRADGTTVLLTTHYLDEARALADRVAVIATGRVVAEGTPEELAARGGATTVSWRTLDRPLPELPDGLTGERDGPRTRVRTDDPTAVLRVLTTWADDLPGLTVEAPSLEDVYLELTTAAAPS